MNPTFWMVFKADLLFSLCSITVTVIVTLAISAWRRKKNAKNMVKAGDVKDLAPRPHVVVFGGKESNPGHCPLCGQGWPLPGPIEAPKEPPK